MSARIPQLYQPRNASPAPSTATSTGTGRDSPAVNPFASTDTLGATVSQPQAQATQAPRESANLSSIGGLLLSNTWDETPVGPRTGRSRSPTIVDSRLPDRPNQDVLHARAVNYDSDDSDYEHDSDRDSRPINAGSIGVGLGLGMRNLQNGPTQPLQPRAKTPQPPPQPTVHRAPVQGPASPTHHYHHQPPQQQQRAPQAPQYQQQQQYQPPQHQPQQQYQAPQRQAPAPQPRVVNFPTPNIAPNGAPNYAPNHVPNHSPSPHGHGYGGVPPPRPIQLPPCPPVTPILAAPPRAHFASPMTPPQSPSIRGFDIMKEKAGTFREDDTEVMNPFSPNARQAGPRTRRNGRSGLGPKSAYSTVDFWKRFSTMGRSGGGESGWMKERKRSIWVKPMFVIPLLLTLIAVGAVIAYVAIKASAAQSIQA